MERKRVRAAFDRQAHQYDHHAAVQQRVIDRLLCHLPTGGGGARRMLDVGAGTGRLLAALHARYPGAFAVGVDLAPGMCAAAAANLAGTGIEVLTADAEHLPFADASFDLVLSSSTFQWLPTLDTAFAEAYRVLAPGGTFCLALFGERTLYELRDSYRRAVQGGKDRTLDFYSAGQVLDALVGAGFCGCSARSEMEIELHPDVLHLLRALKGIGATPVPPVASRGLSERRVMLEMMAIYQESYGRDGKVPASYEVVYAVGRK